MKIDIRHDQEKKSFYVEIAGSLCELKYRKIDDTTLDYYSTFVSEALRNQGIAGAITEFALEYAMSHQYVVIPSCPYVRKYIDNHPKYLQVIKK